MAGPAWKGCPGDLDAGWRKVWEVAQKDIAERGWRDAYHPTLERYVRALREAANALETIRRDGQTVPGSQGQQVLHPSWRVYTDAARIAETAASALGLTPAARARLGEQTPPTSGKFARG